MQLQLNVIPNIRPILLTLISTERPERNAT